jgi:hypothetical protein
MEKLKCECGADAEYFSLGGSLFCKKCADELGLCCGASNKIEHYSEYLKRREAARKGR